MPYDPRAIEAHWQDWWETNGTFRSEIDPKRPKYYVLDMFPYPSGQGLHVGHPKGYIATDAIARYKRNCGMNVLHPMGWDAFGLPAEQHAIETGTHPRETTQQNIENYRRQLRSLGLSYDWSREINTTDPGYVRWTQWIFQKLHEKGLAYLAEVPVNWCPGLGTVLANEEVIDGKSERGEHPVVRVPMRQWMLRITRYADRLLEDLDDLDWPERIKKMQREWIGRSEGARIEFSLPDHSGERIEVFTTRPDTLFGATYLVLAPEHRLVDTLTTPAQSETIRQYVRDADAKSERLRLLETRTKTGVFTGSHATHPVTGERLPVWIADYVLATYGTGAIMAVPGHDERDHAFAKRFDLPILDVVTGGDIAGEAHVGEGTAVNSSFLDGLPTPLARQRMIEWLEAEGKGEGTVSYRLRDWLFSRQRYWGEPLPVLHLDDGSHKLVPEADLPVLLPELRDFHPSGEFESPLGRCREWMAISDPATGAAALRDANTMPNWAGSCWYFLRFCDPGNENQAWSAEAERYWMPVDLYVGGAEHAVLHLLYARFWHKVFYDLGLVHTKEPFQRLLNPGMILGHAFRYYDDNLDDDSEATPHAYPSSAVQVAEARAVAVATGAEVKERWVDSADIRWSADDQPLHPTLDDIVLETVTEKMSKSRGNVVSPDEVIEEFGADALRLFELFMGPLEKGAPWSTDGIPGVFRFLQRAYRLIIDEDCRGEPVRHLVPGSGTTSQARLRARTIQGVTEDIDSLQFNTAIAKLMVFVRDMGRDDPVCREAAETFVVLLSPMAPHLAEELWHRMGGKGSVSQAPWPEADPALLQSETVRLVVQVNGKRRAEIDVPAGADEETVRKSALALDSVQRYLEGKDPKRVVVVPNRLVNVVV